MGTVLLQHVHRYPGYPSLERTVHGLQAEVEIMITQGDGIQAQLQHCRFFRLSLQQVGDGGAGEKVARIHPEQIGMELPLLRQEGGQAGQGLAVEVVGVQDHQLILPLS